MIDKKDPYVLKNGTLRNKLNIRNREKLNEAQRDITFSKFLDISKQFRSKFDVNYIKAIHKHIFEDIFDWAGEFRCVPIVKEEIVIPKQSLDYTPYQHIEKELQNVLDEMNNTNWDVLPLDEKASLFTQDLAKLWRVHPFRDGNTRTTLTFAKQFSEEHNFPLDLGFLLDHLSRQYDENGNITRYSIRDKFVLAALPDEFSPEPEHLTYLMHEAMKSGISKQISNLQNTLDGRTKKFKNQEKEKDRKIKKFKEQEKEKLER